MWARLQAGQDRGDDLYFLLSHLSTIKPISSSSRASQENPVLKHHVFVLQPADANYLSKPQARSVGTFSYPRMYSTPTKQWYDSQSHYNQKRYVFHHQSRTCGTLHRCKRMCIHQNHSRGGGTSTASNTRPYRPTTRLRKALSAPKCSRNAPKPCTCASTGCVIARL